MLHQLDDMLNKLLDELLSSDTLPLDNELNGIELAEKHLQTTLNIKDPRLLKMLDIINCIQLYDENIIYKLLNSVI